MIRLDNMSYHLPQGYLYRDISLFIAKGDRIGLCGKNGIGKSTLLGILAGLINPTEGSVIKEKNSTIGYLTQDIKIPGEMTVRAYLENSNQEISNLNERLEFVNNELCTRTDYESQAYHQLIEEVSDLNERLSVLDAFGFIERIELVLKGLGFKQEDMDRSISSFSGGWQMRAELAKLLVNNPDLLLIDEPTNHLDIVTIQWLEQYLKQFGGALVLISHDRRFLDTVTNRTIEIANQRLYDYKCNYSNYLQLHAEELERVMQAKKNQDKEIKRTEELINKYRAKANKAAFAQNLIKRLDRMDRIEIDTIERRAFNLRFSVPNPSGKRVLEIQRLSKSYGEKIILSQLDGLISRGDKIALLGPNGVGKSTFIKCVTSAIEHNGKMEFGHNVSIGYFAQDSAETLDGEKTVFETIDAIAEGDRRKDIRTILGAFLFSGDDVEKKVKVLSGGERTRLAICKLLFDDFNFLIMDEPTNHLDISSKEILKEALSAYEGTLLLVSHDREFLDGLSNKIWEIRQGGIREHYFNVDEFLNRLAAEENGNAKAEVKNDRNIGQADTPMPDKETRNLKRKLLSKVSKLEDQIARLETELGTKTTSMELLDAGDTESYQRISLEYDQIKTELEKAMLDWEKASAELEELPA